MPTPSRVAEKRASKLERLADLMSTAPKPDIILINKAVLLLVQIEAERQRQLEYELSLRE